MVLVAVAVALGSVPLLCKLHFFGAYQDSVHIPPFLRFSSALAFLADKTSGASVFKGSAVWMNGCYSSLAYNATEVYGTVELTTNRSCALARLSGSTLSENAKKSRNTGESWCSSLIVGVPFVAMSQRARRGLSLRYGGSPSIISMAMIPNDQMSTLRPYSLRVTTSGAIQYGVPTIVVRLLWLSLIWAQKPKSAISGQQVRTNGRVRWYALSLILPSSDSKILSDLISRWMTPFECRCWRPFRVYPVSED